MSDQHIARLEEQLERLIEGMFVNLFGRAISARDIALQLARSMRDHLHKARGGDPRLIAPDHYVIHLHPEVHQQFMQRQDEPEHYLAMHMIDLAAHSGYRLLNPPIITLKPDDTLEAHRVLIKASHTRRPENSTAVMQAVHVPTTPEKPKNPQLLIDGRHTVYLDRSVINIGRSQDNHIVIDDPFISRHHLQLRLRFGVYTLFDVQSKGGTLVNNVIVREHRLQAGDVIHIGDTRMIYIEDDPSGQAGTTQSMPPVET